MKKMIMNPKTNQVMTTTFFFYLPDDVFLILLEYCEKDGIEATRDYQSEWVRHCTKNSRMLEAVYEANFDNMKWIIKKHQGTPSTFI